MIPKQSGYVVYERTVDDENGSDVARQDKYGCSGVDRLVVREQAV